MTKERISKAIEVINYAIQHNISVKESSVKCGYADTYVKNIKALIYDKYENGTIEDELFTMFDEAYKKYLNNKVSNDVNPDAPQDIPASSGGEKTKFKTDGNSGEFEWVGGKNYPADHIRTLDQLLKAADVDTDIWRVKNHVINKWDVTSWKEGFPDTKQNFQVKAWLERDTKSVKEVAIGEIFKKMIKDYEAPVSSIIPKTLHDIKYPSTDDGENNLLEISIFDLHIGKLAWGGETFENYDVKIARDRYLTSIEKLVKRASGFNYSRILFPIGSDFFNSDTINNTTTKGTPQDEDLRWQKTFDVGVRLLVDGISLLKQTGVPVDVVVIPGNHDFERSYYMGSYLEAWFKNDKSVNINNGASPRKYYRFGNVLLGLTHGSEEKEASLPMLMATDIESKPMWSETKFHEWHLGHIHRKRTVKYDINKSRELNEDLGVTIRYLSSLTGTEEWHHKKGYVGSTKAADGFIWNHEFGLVAHLNTNLILD